MFIGTLVCHKVILVFRVPLAYCCGPGSNMHACHAADPGSIPGQDKFPG